MTTPKATFCLYHPQLERNHVRLVGYLFPTESITRTRWNFWLQMTARGWVNGSTGHLQLTGSHPSRFWNLLSGHCQVRLYLSWVGSRWAGLKTNGDSVQLPVPATLSITRQHMGPTTAVQKASHAKVCNCRSKPQNMGRTLKH